MSSRVRTSSLLAAFLVMCGSLLVVGAPSASAIVDRDCSDFASQAAAQRYYVRHGGPQRDPSGLDADNDGIACDSNPCPCSTSTGGGGGGSRPPRKIDTTAGLDLLRSRAIAGEPVGLRATVRPKLKRQVVLQQRRDGRWVAVAAATTTARGMHLFRRATPARDTTYRVLAPSVKRDGKIYKADASGRRTQHVQQQTVLLDMPAQGETSTAADARVTASPARPGRTVRLQRQSAGGWQTVDTGREDARGVVDGLETPLPQRARVLAYRAVVAPSGGAASARSAKEHIDVRDTVAPSPASGLVATAGNAAVALTWSASSSSDRTGYLVQLSGDNGQNWSTYGSPVDGTSSNVTGLINGQTYVFRLITVDVNGNRSSASSTATAVPRVAGPTGLQATPGNGFADLTWVAPSYAVDGYDVYVATSPDGTWAKHNETTVTGTQWQVDGLANLTTYYFRVVAIPAGGAAVSAPSNVASASPQPDPID